MVEEMIYGEAPSLDDMITELRNLNRKINQQ